MFAPEDILYEDNHLLIVNKRCGDLVQPDPSGGDALERQIKETRDLTAKLMTSFSPPGSPRR